MKKKNIETFDSISNKLTELTDLQIDYTIKLNEYTSELVLMESKYRNKFNNYLFETDFKKVSGSEDLSIRKMYVEYLLSSELTYLNLLKESINRYKRSIKIVDNKIKLESYKLQHILNKEFKG